MLLFYLPTWETRRRARVLEIMSRCFSSNYSPRIKPFLECTNDCLVRDLQYTDSLYTIAYRLTTSGDCFYRMSAMSM